MRARELVLLLLMLWKSPAAAQSSMMSGDQALRLVRHDVQLAIDHPVVETIVTQEFDNPTANNLEAFFHYRVPVGATVNGLALWVGGKRREARMLERQRAREIYDGIVRQKRDPALLERLDGNTFRIRIFPVLARSRTRVELRFAQIVEQDAPGRWRVTLRRPPGETVHALRLGIRLRAPFELSSVELEGYDAELRPERGGYRLAAPAAPRSLDSDLHLRYRTAAGEKPRAVVSATTVDGQRLFVAELPLAPRPCCVAVRRRIALLVDASSTMAGQLPRARQLAARILERLGAADEVAVVSFDLLPRQPIVLLALDAARRAAARRLLDQATARGGTAFTPAVLQAIAAGARQIVLITDGGARQHAAELEHLQRLLFDKREVQLSVAMMPGGAEEPLMELAATSGGIYQRLEARADLETIATRLVEQPERRPPRLEGAGQLQLLRAEAGRLLVVGSIPSTSPQLTIWNASREERVTLPLGDDVEEPRGVRALWAAAAIEQRIRRVRLFGEGDTQKEIAEIVQLSRRHTVVSEYTALLATETDADYKRPTSGESWHRRAASAGDDLPPTFQSAPEPHEWALIGVALLLLWGARRRRASPASVL
jgi:hypothetical protein